ncbi:MAG: beta-N-acetylhexosaminidase [Chitinophagaceae bacterium]
MYKFCLFICCLFIIKNNADAQPRILPAPVDITWSKGSFLVNKHTVIATGNAEKGLADVLNMYVQKSAGYILQHTVVQKIQNSIQLQLNKQYNATIGDEGYQLKISASTILLTANKPAGLFYAIQTLAQLLPVTSEAKQSINIPLVSITDYPRFAWRGLMLDISRHFFTIEETKKMIDEMVRYKFNLLHLHLTDDQGWRMEIKSLPLLTKTGAWRVPRTGLWWDRQPPQPNEAATYGGFYTQEQIKDLINYAAAKKVQVMPEVDVPGHSLAAIAAYPYLSCTKMNYGVNPGSRFYTIDDNALCAGNDSTYVFLEKVIAEIAAVFPFEYIHIGGDECYKGFWKKCPVCQQCMKTNNLKNENELQSYFIKKVEKIVQQNGKKLMGWDEILEGGLAPAATVMSWRGMQGGIEAAQQNHKVVMSPNNYCYLDLYQGDPAVEPPTYSMLRLKDSYQFEPVPTGVSPELILGGQGNLWTESVPTFRHAEYMLWPRAFAIAEVLWSPKDKLNWNEFIGKTEAQFAVLRRDSINYATSFYDAIIIPSKNAEDKMQIAFDTEISGLDIYYSFDNTYPDQFSSHYKTAGEKISIPNDAETLRVITYRRGKPIGKMITVALSDLEKRIKKK